MPRGVPKSGFRNTKKRQAAVIPVGERPVKLSASDQSEYDQRHAQAQIDYRESMRQFDEDKKRT